MIRRIRTDSSIICRSEKRIYHFYWYFIFNHFNTSTISKSGSSRNCPTIFTKWLVSNIVNSIKKNFFL